MTISEIKGEKKNMGRWMWHISYAKLIDKNFSGEFYGGPHPEKRNTTQLKNLQSKVLIGANDKF
jgi:hypothetical protein